MSWRTQGYYRGLGDAETDYLKSFDREWDTKSQGRSSTDALEHVKTSIAYQTIPRLMEYAAPSDQGYELEVRLAEVAPKITKFTVPKRRSFGWVIQIVLSGGKRCKASFQSREDALQAYLTLQELSVSILMS